MAEASDELCFVHHVSCNLHAAHPVHELIQAQQLIDTGLHHIIGCLNPVGLCWEHLQVMITTKQAYGSVSRQRRRIQNSGSRLLLLRRCAVLPQLLCTTVAAGTASSRRHTSTVNFSDVEAAKHRFSALPTTGSNAGCESNAAPCLKAMAAITQNRRIDCKRTDLTVSCLHVSSRSSDAVGFACDLAGMICC